MFAELYPKVYQVFLDELKREFQKYRILPYDVNDPEQELFPYLTVVPYSMPRRRYIRDQRNYELLFRLRFVNRVPVNVASEKIKSILEDVGRFFDKFDVRRYTVEIDGNEVQILGDTIDSGGGWTLLRDNAYVIISVNVVYRFENAKY